MKVINQVNKRIEFGKRRMFFQVENTQLESLSGELEIEIKVYGLMLKSFSVILSKILSKHFVSFYADVPYRVFALANEFDWTCKTSVGAGFGGREKLTNKFENLYE